MAPVMAATSAEKVEGSCGMASIARRSILRVASSISESVGTCRAQLHGILQKIKGRGKFKQLTRTA